MAPRRGSPTVVETEIKRSRFIAVIARVDTADEAAAVVEAQRTLRPDARHHCWAYVVGDEPSDRRKKSSDDGEPGGTAGVPMLQVLDAREVVAAVAVVTRYFGGIKLGAGGLVRAYSGAVAAALDETPLVRRERRETYRLGVAHADAGRVEAELRGRGVDVVDTAYGAVATLTLTTNDPARLEDTVAAATSGGGVLEPAGAMWADVP